MGLKLALGQFFAEISSENIVCLSRLLTYLLILFTNVSVEANIVDPDLTAPTVASGSTLFDQESSKTF